MKSSSEFATGLDGMYDGLEIAIREGRLRNSDTSKGAAARKHGIASEVRDEEFVVQKTGGCSAYFEDTTIYIHVENGKLEVHLKDPATGRERRQACFEY